MAAEAPVFTALIGGTGFYEFLEPLSEYRPDTPFGPTSAPITIAGHHDRRIAFLPRHGRTHDFLPHEIPYRANMWALRQLGVRQIVATCAVGSLQATHRIGDVVLVDQYVDRTHSRDDTYFSGTDPAHISMARPYCDRINALAAEGMAGRPGTPTVRLGGTMVVIQGPRFSSGAESHWYHSQGWAVVNMTGYPEVVLARELQMCYASLCYVTDYDVAMTEVTQTPDASGTAAVTTSSVLAALADGRGSFGSALIAILDSLPDDTDCTCHHALDHARF